MTDPVAVYNWHRLDDRTTTSGQPTEEQLAAIAALGVRRVVNLGLHSHEKALPDEAASVAGLGMTYVHILGMDEAKARADLERVWQPDEVWAAFIARATAPLPQGEPPQRVSDFDIHYLQSAF